jgi:beta-lactam-binding protein with PASTA domain
MLYLPSGPQIFLRGNGAGSDNNMTEWKRSAAVVALFLAGCGSSKVPNLVGSSETDAASALAKAKMHAGAIRLDVASEPQIGKIVSQSPAAGTPSSAAPGGAVDFVVGAVATPTVSGRTPAEATQELNRAGLALGNVKAVSELTGHGAVKEQNPTAGTPVRRGTPVDITVATSLISDKLKDGILDQLLGSDVFKNLNEADRQKIAQALQRH